jgi:hypothetical protein
VSGAQELNVRGCKRCSAEREGEIVVEVEFVGRAAPHALAVIPLPDFELDGCRDDSPP